MRKMWLTLLTFLLFPSMTNAQTIEADKTAARIMVYFSVGRDENPSSNITVEQFQTHMLELKYGDYTVISLADMVEAYKEGTELPKNSVILTFDGGDRSILQNAVPLMEEYGFPYTIFIAPERANREKSHYINWRDIKKLQKSSLATIGIHDENYANLNKLSAEGVKRSINNAVSLFREKTKKKPNYFSYPSGMYNEKVLKVISSYNFDAALGQHSGVAHAGINMLTLPRFTMTENYGDTQRFIMTANALPLPITEKTPETSHANHQPAIGFTLANTNINTKSLSCFASNQEKPSTDIIGKNRVEIRLKEKIKTERFRINCTIPTKENKWRWIGFLLSTSNQETITIEN